MFDRIISDIIMPLQVTNMELFYAFSNLIVDAVHEIYNVIKEYNLNSDERILNIRKAFFQNT